MRIEARNIIPAVLSALVVSLTWVGWPAGLYGQNFVVDKPLTAYVPPDKTMTPAEAVADFKLPDDLAIGLVAREPQTIDPVGIVFDEDLRLYVVEMGTYPAGSDGDEKQGRVRLLEDRDGDGLYETSTIFADKLGYPTNAIPWDGGLYVSSAPHIWYFKDTDGDNRADVRRVVFEGFGVWNPQHEVNGLQWGLDNWIYCSNGDSHGTVTSPKFPGKKVPIRGRDFRFRPGTEEFEAISGYGQFGVAFDNWGRRFLCSNRLIIHEMVLPSRYVRRNPYLVVRSPHVNVCEHGDAPRVYPTSEQTPRWIDLTHLGYITAAGGVFVYRGNLLPPAYHGNAFVTESVANLVVRLVLRNTDRPVVSARRARPEVEFLTSTDPWCRLVSFADGPDGALYVNDMYRQFIEHTEWIPDELEKVINVQAGNHLGRIYRVFPKGWTYKPPPRLGGASTAELVQALADPNGWRRTTAQRLLVTRKDTSAVPALRELAAACRLPQGRVHALWTLHALGGLDAPTIERALDDPHPRARENAVRLAETVFGTSKVARDKVLALADHADSRLRFQVAFSLGEMDDPRAVQALAGIANRDGDDRWVRTAVLSSVANRTAQLLTELATKDASLLKGSTPAGRIWVAEFARMIGTRQSDDEIATLLRLCEGRGSGPSWWRMIGLENLAKGLAQGKAEKIRLPAAQPRVLKLLSDATVEVQRAGQRIASFLDMTPSPEQAAIVKRAVKSALDDKQPLTERVQAVEMLAYGQLDEVLDPFESLLGAQQPRRLQAAAVSALARFRDEEAGLFLVDMWRGLGPAVQKQALDILLRRTEWVPLLLDAVEEEVVPVFAFDAMRRDQLLRHPNEKLRTRAEALFKTPTSTDTAEALAALKPALELEGHTKHGGELFVELCATCHKVGDVGQQVGPDLTSVIGRSKDALLVDILAPNAATAPGYMNYLVETTRGEVISGIIMAETANSVTLAKSDGSVEVMLRQNIEAMSSSMLSLMPEDLGEGLKPQDMADLLAYMKALPSTKRAVGYWRLDHDGADSAGAVPDAAVVGDGRGNAPAFVDDVPSPWILDPLTTVTRQNDGAVRCDGEDDYLRLGAGDSTDLDSEKATTAQTLEAFVRLDAPVNGDDRTGLLVGKWNQTSDGGDHMALFVNGSGTIQCDAQSSVGKFDATHNSGRGGNLNDRRWHHVAAVYSYDESTGKATVTVYQDYKPVSTKTYEVKGPLRRAAISYQLGGEGDAKPEGFRFVKATFDEVRICDSALTAEEFLRAGEPPSSRPATTMPTAASQ